MADSALTEVTEMWDWDAGATVPANVSAGLLVQAALASNGRDQDGSAYIAGALNLAVASGLFTNDFAAQGYPESDPKLTRRRALFAWNLYSHHG